MPCGYAAPCHTLVAKSFLTPEEQASESIDGMLLAARWLIQDRIDANIDAGRGVAIREFALGQGFGEADYLLFADGQAVGVIEAKKEGSTLTGFEIQTQKYSEGIPAAPSPPRGGPCRSAMNPRASRPGLPTFWNSTPPAGPFSASTGLRPCPSG
jgi:hypothetical protein